MVCSRVKFALPYHLLLKWVSKRAGTLFRGPITTCGSQFVIPCLGGNTRSQEWRKNMTSTPSALCDVINHAKTMKAATMWKRREAQTYELTKRKWMHLISYHTLCTGKKEICTKGRGTKVEKYCSALLLLWSSTRRRRRLRCAMRDVQRSTIKKCNVSFSQWCSWLSKSFGIVRHADWWTVHLPKQSCHIDNFSKPE
jgi:hypothetical protein